MNYNFNNNIYIYMLIILASLKFILIYNLLVQTEIAFPSLANIYNPKRMLEVVVGIKYMRNPF